MQEKFLPIGKISDNLRAAILAKGINQNQLAEAVGVSYVTISRYMSELRMPGTEELYRMAKILDVSMEFLLTGETSEQTEWQKRALAAEKKLRTLSSMLPLYSDINEKLARLNSQLTELTSEE